MIFEKKTQNKQKQKNPPCLNYNGAICDGPYSRLHRYSTWMLHIR